MDNLMQYLYQEYYKKQQRGFTDDEFRRAAEQIAGRSLADFFDIGVNSADPIDYNAYFAPVGLTLTNVAGRNPDGYLGASTQVVNGRTTVTGVRRGGAAYADGLNVGDEVLAVDQVRVGDDLQRLMAGRRPGETLTVLVNRSGLLRELPIKLLPSPLVSYRLEPVANPTAEQQALYKTWLYIK